LSHSPDHHKDRQPQADLGRIELERLTAGHTRRPHRLQPAPAGVLRQADLLGQRALRQRRIGLQGTQDGTVCLI